MPPQPVDSREVFILVPGRTSRQGTSLNQGKSSEEYRVETETVLLNASDMKRLDICDGDQVTLTSASGSATVRCKAGPKDEIPTGLLFLPYGPPVCALIGGDTHGTGMPDSKSFDVRLEKLSRPTPSTL